MPLTVEEARELRDTLVEAFNPLYGIRLGNVVGQDAVDAARAAIKVLNRIDLAAKNVSTPAARRTPRRPAWRR